MAVRIRNGRLYLDFYCYLPTGARVRCFESTGLTESKKNLKIARQKNKAIRYHQTNGTFHYPDFFPHGSKIKHWKTGSDMLFQEWWDQWMKEKSLRPITEYNMGLVYKNHLAPHFGQVPVHSIGEHELLVFRRTLESTLGPTTINLVFKHLCSCLHLAYRRGIIQDHPCREIRALREQRPDIEPFSFEELRAWLDDLKTRDPVWHDMIFFWSRTGLRPGELYALKWKDVDYFNQKISIRRSRCQTFHTNGKTKTLNSERDIPLRPAVIDVLKRQEARTRLMDQYIWMDADHRFKNAPAVPWVAEKMKRAFRHRLSLAGIRYRPPKQMRHTFATLHLAAGENPTWVSETLGHASVKVTWEKYNRFIPNLTRDDGSAFEKVFDGRGQTGKSNTRTLNES